MNTNPSSVTRLSLISLAQAQDARAWNDLVKLYSPLVAFWCRKSLPEADINDTIQDVFFVVARSLEDFQFPGRDPSSAPNGPSESGPSESGPSESGPSDSGSSSRHKGGFRAWLWKITRNKIIDAVRRNQRLPDARGGSTAAHVVQSVPDLPAELDDSEPDEQTEYNLLLHRALELVRSEFQEKTFQAFWRSTVDGIPTDQVARELEITKATVRQHRARVLRRLRQQIGELE